MEVRLYSKEDCGQCTMTEKVLNSENIEYETLKMDQDQEALEFVKDLGYLQAPVVYTEHEGQVEHWSGFRPDLIKKLGSKILEVGAIQYAADLGLVDAGEREQHLVHNHGLDYCPEQLINGKLYGECIPRPETREPQLEDNIELGYN